MSPWAESSRSDESKTGPVQPLHCVPPQWPRPLPHCAQPPIYSPCSLGRCFSLRQLAGQAVCAVGILIETAWYLQMMMVSLSCFSGLSALRNSRALPDFQRRKIGVRGQHSLTPLSGCGEGVIMKRWRARL